MNKFKAESTVTAHHEGTYFRTAIPRDIALNILGLKTDLKKQRLVWTVEKGKVVVEKK